MIPIGLFVTGTDTGVGKTRIATALCRAYAARGRRVAAMKPVASGCAATPAGLRNEDALSLWRAMTVPADYEEVNPYAFEAAIAPHLAAAETATTIDFAVLDRAYETLRQRSDALIVEGAGGWLVPLDAHRSFADLALRWHLEVILVVGMRLGCLNHALLTAESIERRGLHLRGWVANAIDFRYDRLAENVASLRMRIGAPCLAVCDFAPVGDTESLAGTLAAHLIGAR